MSECLAENHDWATQPAVRPTALVTQNMKYAAGLSSDKDRSHGDTVK